MKKQKSVWSYIKGYKFNSLLFKNLAHVFILVALPLLLVLSLNYRKFSHVVNNRIMDMNEELLRKSAVVTDNIMVDVLNVLDKICQFSEITEIVQISETDADYNEKVDRVVALFREHTLSNSFIKSAYIYSDINEMLIDSSGTQHITQLENREKWYYIHEQFPMEASYILVNHVNSVFICQPIWTDRGSRAGILVLDAQLQKIRDLLENEEVAQQGTFFVVDSSGQVMYCSEQDYFTWDEDVRREYTADIAGVETGESILIADHGTKIISVMESIHQSWRYVFVTEIPNFEKEVAVIRDFLISSVIVGVVSSIIAAYMITLLTYRPMKKIMDVINNPQVHWNEKEASKESNELLYITSYILADRNIKKEISEELEARIRALRQAQFRALQFQIDPHFLYNTLETIKWGAVEEMGLGNKTSKMLTKLARLYRIGLENDDVIVTLKEELDFLKVYIEILRIRFGDSIRFNWRIDRNLYDCNIVKMCLQPVVENAINHGLRPKEYHGNVTISAYYQENRLCVSVENDGLGISPAEIKSLNEKLQTGVGFDESKVGLRNVNERIKLIYGKEYGVSISSFEKNRGVPSEHTADVQVVLTFPCREFLGSEETNDAETKMDCGVIDNRPALHFRGQSDSN